MMSICDMPIFYNASGQNVDLNVSFVEIKIISVQVLSN